jgi:arylsulfatase A-like enzyme
MLTRLLRKLLSWAAYVAAVAFFWGATEAFINYRWAPKGVWRTDLWLSSTYNRVIFYAAAVAVITLLSIGLKALIERRRPAAPGRWSGAVAVAAVVAVNAGWLTLGLVNSYELNLGLFKLDIQERAPFFEYWGLFAVAGAGLAVALALALGRRSWARITARYLQGAGAALFLAVAVAHHATQMLRPRADGPNIILIVLDAWRADKLQPELMPNLYAFSREKALFFERTWTNGTWTLPAMTTAFTGQYHDTHKLRRHPDSDRRNPTLAQILYEAGYETAAFSANRLLNRHNDINDGFENFYFPGWNPVLNAVHFYETHWYGPAVRDVFHGKPTYRDSQILTRKMVAYANRRHKRPYFLWVHYMDPHEPYKPPPGYYDPADEKYIKDYRPGNPRLRDAYKRLYDDECVFMDDLLGEALAEVASRPRTVVAVTADHGEEFREHNKFTFGHGKSMYDTLVRIPFFMTLPGAEAEVVRTPVSLVDVAPTFLTLAGREPPPTMQGRPFLTSAGEVVHDETRPVFIGSFFFQLKGKKIPRRDAVVIWPHKLILFHRKPGRQGEYYDLAADPGEMNRLPPDDNVKKLRRALRAWRKENKQAYVCPDYGDEAAPDLRALGYIK